jgi:adenine-specific DNA-methyltransferase
VFESKGGFDIVIGNPPYVRQEAIKDLKPALQAEYDCYTGVADLYVYFYEQGLRLLKPKGYLSYISSNKYFRAGYGEKLRKYLAANSQIHNITDFGELPVFDAATFPMIFSDKYLIVTKIKFYLKLP